MVGCMDRTRGVKILIADDNEALRQSLCSAFEPMGFIVYLAPGGTTAVTVARKWRIDIAILDIKNARPRATGAISIGPVPDTLNGSTPCFRNSPMPLSEELLACLQWIR